MLMINKQKQSGFTLIEILVVVAIIGLLATVVTTSLSQARLKARDSKRRGDLVQLQKALEIYYNTNNRYPCTGDSGAVPNNCCGTINWWAATGNCGSGTVPKDYSGANGYIPNLAPTFVGFLPADPRPSTTACSGYSYRSDGVSYKIISNAVSGAGGPESFPALGESFYDPARPTSGIMVTNNSGVTSAW